MGSMTGDEGVVSGWRGHEEQHMSAMKIAILVALLFGLAWLLGCNHKDADEQQPSASKPATGQQAAQPPTPTSEADEGEEGEEGPASPAAAAAEQPAPQQTAGKQFAYNFDGDTLGQLPAKFHSAKTGGGAAEKWVVSADPTAPSKPNVVTQTSTDQTDYRFPLLISDEGSFQDLHLSVKFKAVSGNIDRAGGLVFRLKDPNNYYIVRANALENNYRLYHVVNGRRSQFAGANLKVTSGEWHELRVEAVGNKITATTTAARKLRPLTTRSRTPAK
jgi:hypothetical protein